jgi:pSer/pThr/pTyr-binding forkhead associated (FHA) protein
VRICFGPFLLDSDAPQLRRDQEFIRLSPKGFDVLRTLVEARPNVISKDADVSIRIEASTVSRRHACIVVDAEGAVLQDFGSKNGTFRNDQPVSAPTALANGDDVRVGSQLLTFRVRLSDSTETHVKDSR